MFNSRYRTIAELTELKIDTKGRRLSLRLALAGEKEPVEIQVGEYTVRPQDQGLLLNVANVTTSRQWLTEFLRTFVVGRSIPINTRAAPVLKALT